MRAGRANEKTPISWISFETLSKNLPIVKPQLTSTFPISHRISGAFLATIVSFFYLLCLKIGWICFTYEKIHLFFFYSEKLILISVQITALALDWNLYNGVRHWFTGYFSLFELEMTVPKLHLYLSFEIQKPLGGSSVSMKRKVLLVLLTAYLTHLLSERLIAAKAPVRAVFWLIKLTK